MTKVICITGAKRHGKGEVGNAIERLVPGTFQVGYADKLKISMMRALGFERSEQALIALADEAKADWTVQVTSPSPSIINSDVKRGYVVHTLTGRQLLQRFGTEGGRKTFGDEFWLDQVLPNPRRAASRAMGDTVTPEMILKEQLDGQYNGAPVVAITDCRFDNEAQRAIDCGGEVWEVVRPELVDSSADTHASEQGIDPSLITTTIVNDGTLEQLEWHVEQALELAGILEPS